VLHTDFPRGSTDAVTRYVSFAQIAYLSPVIGAKLYMFNPAPATGACSKNLVVPWY